MTTRIMVPPGIGDSYWCMVKLRGFLKAKGLETADVFIQDGGGPRRTQPFLETVPFIQAGGYMRVPISHRRILHEAYRTDGRTVFTDVPGVDYFMSYNGVLGAGRSLEAVDPEFGVEWYLPLKVSERSLAYRAQMQIDGPYVAVYLPDGGFYRMWWSQFGPGRTTDVLVQLRERLGVRIVFFGAEWDKGSLGWVIATSEVGATWQNFIGETDYEQLVGLLLGARVVFGYPSGATILPMVWRVPTVLLWSRYFVPAFWKNVAPPDSPYVALDVEGLAVGHVVDAVRAIAS